MKSADREKWIKSASKEIRELEEHSCWEEVPISEAKGYSMGGDVFVWRLARKNKKSYLNLMKSKKGA